MKAADEPAAPANWKPGPGMGARTRAQELARYLRAKDTLDDVLRESPMKAKAKKAG